MDKHWQSRVRVRSGDKIAVTPELLGRACRSEIIANILPMTVKNLPLESSVRQFFDTHGTAFCDHAITHFHASLTAGEPATVGAARQAIAASEATFLAGVQTAFSGQSAEIYQHAEKVYDLACDRLARYISDIARQPTP